MKACPHCFHTDLSKETLCSVCGNKWIDIDYMIVSGILALWKKKVVTMYSCEGHSHNFSYVCFPFSLNLMQIIVDVADFYSEKSDYEYRVLISKLKGSDDSKVQCITFILEIEQSTETTKQFNNALLEIAERIKQTTLPAQCSSSSVQHVS